MIRAIDIFASYWFYFMFLSFAIGMVGFGYLMYWKHGNSKNPKKTLKIGAYLFGQVFLTWIIGFGSLGIVTHQARSEFESLLESESIELTVNGQTLNKSQNIELIKILKSIRGMAAHHSHPTEEIEIQLKYNDNSTTIYLKQDSEKKTEYWVFWNKYRNTTSNEIGRITSEAITKYG